MTQKYFTLIFILSVFCISSVSAQQKFGHVNSGNLLEAMPETEMADKKLMVLEDSLYTVLDTMSARLQVKYANAMKAVNAGTLTKVQQANLEKELNDEQMAIQSFQKEAQNTLMLRRQQFLSPLVDKLNNAIQTIAKEGNYAYIFDVSTGSMLFADESDDISKKVAERLGIKYEEKP